MSVEQQLSEYPQPSFTRISAAAKRTGLSRSHLYDLSKRGQFPAILKIGERASAVITAELDEWIRDKIKAASKPSSSTAA